MSETEVRHPYAGSTSNLPGDAGDLDGDVDDDDLSLLLAGWGQDTDWGNGEFTGLAPVNDDDLSLLLSNWSPPSSGAVPEPTTVGLLVAGALLMFRGKRSFLCG